MRVTSPKPYTINFKSQDKSVDLECYDAKFKESYKNTKVRHILFKRSYMNVIYSSLDSAVEVSILLLFDKFYYYTTRYIMSNDIFFTMSPACIDYACH